MIIPPTSPNRIMWRQSRAFALLAARPVPVAVSVDVPEDEPGEFAFDGITQRYTT